jgi:hypothetical protein
VGLDPDTVRAIPALTLILAGGFESQPVELHAPVAPAGVRDFLVQRWQLAETQPDAPRQRELLYRALETALTDPASPVDAELLLLASLVPPEHGEDGLWTVFHLAGEGDVALDPQACEFRFRRDPTLLLSGVAELVEHVEHHVLPVEREPRRRMLVEAEEQAAAARFRDEAAEARQTGFRWHDESASRLWRFCGRRQGLTALCERLRDIADHHAPPPPGARPAQVRIGGLLHGISVEVNRYDGIAGDVLCATPERLRALADELQSAIDNAAAGETVSVSALLGDARWSFALEVTQ